jgi:hypothetical protein
MDVDTQDEEFANLLVDRAPAERDGARAGEKGGERGGDCDGCGKKVFEERGLGEEVRLDVVGGGGRSGGRVRAYLYALR